MLWISPVWPVNGLCCKFAQTQPFFACSHFIHNEMMGKDRQRVCTRLNHFSIFFLIELLIFFVVAAAAGIILFVLQ
jgi:hypothetical protein